MQTSSGLTGSVSPVCRNKVIHGADLKGRVFSIDPAVVVVHLLCTCVDDVDKLWLQRGPAHQEAIHIALRRQLSAVCSCDRTWRE